MRFSYKNSCLLTASLIVVQQLCGVYRLPSRIDLTRLFTFSEYTHRVDTATLAHSTSACLYPRTRFAARRICEWKRIVKTKRRNKRRRRGATKVLQRILRLLFIYTRRLHLYSLSRWEQQFAISRLMCAFIVACSLVTISINKFGIRLFLALWWDIAYMAYSTFFRCISNGNQLMHRN